MSAAPPTMSVDEMIRHYQRSIERSQSDPKRILHCLNKLQRMHVTVNHLQSTGIGRTVNILRKDDGDVGNLAKSLITKWKQMVASESSDHSEENHSENVRSSEEQEETVDSSEKSQRHHEHSSSKHKSSGHRNHSKHRNDERKCVAEENGEKSSKRRRSSHDSERNGHKSSSHHKDSRHRKNENHHDEQHNDNKHHKRSNGIDSVSSTSSSHKRHRDNEPDPSGTSKRIKCDSTTSPLLQRNKEKKSSKSKSKSIDDGIEIDNSTGTSFADALGMIEPLPKLKSSLSSSSVNSHKTSQGKNSMASSSSSSSLGYEKKERHKERSKPSTSTDKSNTPTLLTTKAKLPPLDDLLKDLPPPVECVIRNDYKPLPVNALVMDCLYRPNNSKSNAANDAAALCASTTSKNQRTKVYSGTKTGQLLSVPSLHELCIRFLQKNIDALEYTGGVPFEILRPVLERASPNQLFIFEHFNPYLMEDSDVLWQQHCKNKFRAFKRQEMETWREMYTRCEKEQEERLASLANNIKKSISVAVPVRQTKLAYVDTAVKPPRGIVKKQNQFGTHAKLVATPAARVDALSSVATNMAKVGDARLRTSAAIRDTAQAQSSNGALKPKKAPLMMKTLQLMKGRFKR